MRKLVPLLISSSLAVDRGNFKTCKDASFVSDSDVSRLKLLHINF